MNTARNKWAIMRFYGQKTIAIKGPEEKSPSNGLCSGNYSYGKEANAKGGSK